MHPLAPTRALRQPVWWAALALLLVNDHVLKGSGLLPGSLTGKLSDVAGLIVAPVLLAVLIRARTRRGAAVALAAVGVWFCLVKTVPATTRAMELFMATIGVPWRLVCDPTDLLALPALGVAAWLLWGELSFPLMAPAPSRMTLLERGAAMISAIACMATSYSAGAPPVSSPGLVITQGSPVYVIESSTGRRLASPKFEEGIAPAIETGGVVYVVSGRTVRGISIETNKQVFEYVEEDAHFHWVSLTDGRRLFLISTPPSGSNDERLVALDLKTKKRAWSARIPSEEGARPTSKHPILAGGLVIVPAGSKLVAYDPATGARRWTHTGASELTWPTASGQMVYVVDEQGVIAALEIDKGNVAWRYAVGSYDGFGDRWDSGPRLGAGQSSLVFIREGQLMAIHAKTRAPRWRGPLVEDAVIGQTVAVAKLEDDKLVGIDMASGKRLWVLEDDGLLGDPVVAEGDGLMLMRTSENDVRAYGLSTGKLQWRFDLSTGNQAEHLNTSVLLRRNTL